MMLYVLLWLVCATLIFSLTMRLFGKNAVRDKYPRLYFSEQKNSWRIRVVSNREAATFSVGEAFFLCVLIPPITAVVVFIDWLVTKIEQDATLPIRGVNKLNGAK